MTQTDKMQMKSSLSKAPSKVAAKLTKRKKEKKEKLVHAKHEWQKPKLENKK